METIKVTDKDTEDFKKKFEENPGAKAYKDRVKFVFPDTYPAFKNFHINNGKLYVFTFKKRGDRSEVIVMDSKGNILKTVFLPDGNYFSISEDRFYYLKENEDEEEWELWMEKL